MHENVTEFVTISYQLLRGSRLGTMVHCRVWRNKIGSSLQTLLSFSPCGSYFVGMLIKHFTLSLLYLDIIICVLIKSISIITVLWHLPPMLYRIAKVWLLSMHECFNCRIARFRKTNKKTTSFYNSVISKIFSLVFGHFCTVSYRATSDLCFVQ